MNKTIAIAAGLVLVSGASQAQQPFIGEVQWFGNNFCPAGWIEANGAVLPIAQYETLFALIGTTYGGDGEATFALPDLRSRVAVHAGAGPGLSNYVIGQSQGTEQVTIAQAQMPAHSHALATSATLRASSSPATTTAPGGAVLANGGTARVYATGPATVDMGPSISVNGTLSPAGGSQPVDIRKPVLALKACVATEGIFPSRS